MLQALQLLIPEQSPKPICDGYYTCHRTDISVIDDPSDDDAG
ncbi:hypothetical protein OG462_42950 [Streptomyces sp. NBC_01077]|nr:hypothetical protein OG462_02055 [Streptomyces sp. NBC_01077]WSV43568.1 hypothetical protein OG462_42950 [Streptomyces sp. NBC_01077]